MNEISNLKKGALFLLVLNFVAAFLFQGDRGLYDTTEGRYAECSREMLESGNYLEPTLAYRPHWTKPPLTYWAIATGIRTIGPNEWGVRIYNSIAFFLTTVVVSLLGTMIFNPAVGLIAGFIYVSSPFPVLGATAVTTDTLLAFWEILAMFAYFKARGDPNEVRAKYWVVAMWGFFGLGFFTKGFPALLPLILIIIWQFHSPVEMSIASIPGIGLFAFASAWWYIFIFVIHPDLFHFLIQTEVVQRVSSNRVHNSEWYKPLTLYLPILTFGMGQWLFFLVKLFKGKWRISRERITCFLHNKSSLVFLSLWFLLPLLIFSIVKSRLPLYVLPLCAPLSLMMAYGIYKKSTYRERVIRTVAVMAAFSVILLAAVKKIGAFYPNKNDMRALFTMCRTVGTETSNYSFMENKLYGLQFYLDGNLKRLSLNGSEAWADGKIQDILDRIKLKDPEFSGPHLFVTGNDHAPTLRQAFADSGIQVQETIQGRYTFVKLLENGAELKARNRD